MSADCADLTRLARLVDELETRTTRGYLLLDEVRAAAPELEAAIQASLADELLLTDKRTRVDAATGATSPVTLCRLNRHHPVARALSGWDR